MILLKCFFTSVKFSKSYSIYQNINQNCEAKENVGIYDFAEMLQRWV